MHPTSILLATSIAGACGHQWDSQGNGARRNIHQQPLSLQTESPASGSPMTKRVAIIGAGAAGASAAYHLRQCASAAGIPVSISIFERHDRIGGRAATVNAYNIPGEPVELGASIFVKVNSILMSAAKDFRLSLQATDERVPKDFTGDLLGIWDGQSFVYRAKGGWWDMAKLLWRYGMSPLRAQKAMKRSVGKFLGMYDEEVFPWEDLNEAVSKVGLLEETGVTGWELLAKNGVGDAFSREIVQTATRVNYAQNLGVISGLETMVCLAPQGAVSVVGGNWRIFDAMATKGADAIKLGAAVTSIQRETNRTYTLSTRFGSTTDSMSFDEVIIATPYQFANLSISPSLPSPPDTIPYVQLYVTLFTSPHLLSPEFFNLSANSSVPLAVLTTLPANQQNSHGHRPTDAGLPGFFSVSLLRPIMNKAKRRQEYIYKIFSPSALKSDFMAGLLGVPTPNSILEFSQDDVSWLHQKLWHSYPVEYPRLTFEKIKLASGLWYTSGMDSFISTMETNALAGKNVARLMVNEWTQGGSETVKAKL